VPRRRGSKTSSRTSSSDTAESDFNEAAADRVCAFFEGMLRHSKGELAGRPFLLMNWQRRMLRELFGRQSAPGVRRYRSAYIELPKKQGKSTTLAGIALYMILADGEQGAEVYGAASDREQAGIIYRESAAMVRASPALSRHLEVIDSRKTILHKKSNSFYRVLSADAFRAEGLNIHALLFDELHAQRDRRLWDALRYGGAARKQPLLLSITTAGYDRRSICWEQHQYAERCLSDAKFDPTFYPLIYAAPQDCVNDGSWKEESVWKQANPSLGETITVESFAADAREAEQSPSKLNSFLRYRLNVWTTQDNRWFKPETWQLGSEPLRPFGDRPVYAGLDLATTYDLTAMVLVCPDPSDGSIDVLPFFWIPEANAVERIQRDKVPYDTWIRDGHMRVTDGNTTDYTILHRDILEICQTYRVQQLGVDIRFNAQMLANTLQGDGVDVRGFSQGGRTMCAPARTLENLVQGGKVRHANHPVLSWCADNVAIAEDRFQNIYPSKAKSTERIDGIVALCQAIGCWITSDGQTQSGMPEILII
jgi:phage terminase large subunit-like protein